MNRRDLFKVLSSGCFAAYIAPADRATQDPVWLQWVRHLSDVEGEITLGNAYFVVGSDGQLWKLDQDGWSEERRR
jgi:hypothetical protein